MGVIAVLAVAIVVAVGITPSPARPARPVVVSTNIWAPYVTDKDGKGPASLVVTDVLEGLGYAPTVRVGTWDRALEDVRRGRSVAAFPLVASAERRADFLISDPLLNFEYGLFRDVTAGPAPVSLDALRSLRVAGIQGYDYWPELDAAVGKYVQFNTSEAAFAALARGEVDIVAEGTVAGNTILADPGFAVDAARFARIDAPWASSQQSLHAMVARTSAGEEFLQEFNASLELCYVSGHR